MGPGAGPGGEDALLVEDAVIGQLVLEAQRRDLAAIGEHRGVVELAVLAPGRAEDASPARPSVSAAKARAAAWQAATKEGFSTRSSGG